MQQSLLTQNDGLHL